MNRSKSKKIFLIVLIVIILIMGVGYAALSNSTLNIKTSATSAASTFKVVFDSTNAPRTATEPSDSTTITVNAPTPEADATSVTCTFGGLCNTQDKAAAAYTIVNSGNVTASKVYFTVGETVNTVPNSGSFSYTTSDGVFHFKVEPTSPISDFLPGATQEVRVIVTLLKKVATPVTANCVVSVVAVPAAE